MTPEHFNEIRARHASGQGANCYDIRDLIAEVERLRNEKEKPDES